MNLVIDIGNTVAKVAVFDGVSLLEVAYDSNRNLEHLSDIYSKYHFEKAIVATVIDLSEQVLAQLALLPIPVLWLNETTPLPVVNLYETPRTLGYDRMAAVVAANEQFPGKDILVIDAGTRSSEKRRIDDLKKNIKARHYHVTFEPLFDDIGEIDFDGIEIGRAHV